MVSSCTPFQTYVGDGNVYEKNDSTKYKNKKNVKIVASKSLLTRIKWILQNEVKINEKYALQNKHQSAAIKVKNFCRIHKITHSKEQLFWGILLHILPRNNPKYIFHKVHGLYKKPWLPPLTEKIRRFKPAVYHSFEEAAKTNYDVVIFRVEF